MALVVVGGHSRDVGKTSVVAGLIAALPEYHWTAMKITQYGHGICSRNGEPCECASRDHSWAVTAEQDRTGKSDTSRFLRAGARHVYWVRTEQGRLSLTMSMVRMRLGQARNAIIESNSILEFVNPDVYLSVLNPGKDDFKKSARKFLDRADAVVLHETDGAGWQGISIPERPMFRISPPEYVTPEIVDFVRERLRARAEVEV